MSRMREALPKKVRMAFQWRMQRPAHLVLPSLISPTPLFLCPIQEIELERIEKTLRMLAGKPDSSHRQAPDQVHHQPAGAWQVHARPTAFQQQQPPQPLQPGQHPSAGASRPNMPQPCWPELDRPVPGAASCMQTPRPARAGWVGHRVQPADPSAGPWQGTAPQARLHHASDPTQPWRGPADAALPTGLQSGWPSPAAVSRAQQDPSAAGAAGRQQQREQALDGPSPKPYTVTEPDSPSIANATASGPLPAAPWHAGPCGAPAAPRSCLYTETTVTRWHSARGAAVCAFAMPCTHRCKRSAVHQDILRAFP